MRLPGLETMSHHSDEGSVVPGSDSFWEPGNYKRTTKRIDDGERLCKDLIALVQERANIEKEFAKQLKQWSGKWNNLIEKGPEYGTTEAAWKAVLNEADRRCELHLRVKDNLVNDVIQSIKNWQKDNYHKQLMQIKERKELDDQFKRAQKPWVKLLEKVEKAKGSYHIACKNEKSAVNQERNATKDSSLSQDSVRKLQDKVSKCQDNVKKSKEQYELAVSDINNYNSRYQEDMTDVFERCQRKEAQRLQTFKDTLFQIHKCLNISEDQALPQIYDEFYHTVNNADHEKDLRWWSNTHGVNMPMAWPTFEEYTEEFREISTRKKNQIPDGNITLINQRTVGDDLPEYNAKPTSKKSDMNGGSRTGTTSINNPRDHPDSDDSEESEHSKRSFLVSATIPFWKSPALSRCQSTESMSSVQRDLSDTRHSTPNIPTIVVSPPPEVEVIPRPAARHSLMTHQRSSGDTFHSATGSRVSQNPFQSDSDSDNESSNNGTKEPNPFDDESEEWDDGQYVLTDNGEPGQPVRALYDYEAAEPDELTFKTGDQFEKLEEEDEQGWCKGRKDGRVGLYPANYVETV